MKDLNLKLAQTSTIGASLAVAAVVALTVAGELSPGLKDLLKQWFYHHWIGKGVIALTVYLVATAFDFFLTPDADSEGLKINLIVLTCVSLVGFVGLYGFFVFEALVK